MILQGVASGELPEGTIYHLEVQPFARIRVGEGDGLVELDAEPGSGRGNHVARLPADGFFQDFRVEAAPLLDAFQDQKIGRARRDLNIGRAHHRTAIQVRGDLRVMDLGERRDLLRLEEPADAPEIHLQDIGGARGKHASEFVLGSEALAGRDRDGGGTRDERHLLRHLGWYRLLEPERVVGLEMLGQSNGTGGRELSVRSHQEVRAHADGLAYQPHEAYRAFDLLLRGLPWVVSGEAAGGVELDARESLL